jgi:hypothetical protein
VVQDLEQRRSAARKTVFGLIVVAIGVYLMFMFLTMYGRGP